MNIRELFMHLRIVLTTAVALLPAVLVHTMPAEAQVGTSNYKFTCVVDQILPNNTFGSLQRPVVCPVAVSFSQRRLGVGMGQRQVRNISAACLIPKGETRCEGTFSPPNEPDLRVAIVTTARSLLNEAETLAGALSIPNSPEVRQTASGYEVRHTYAFPQVANKFHNASSPCDINGDGAVNPLDMLALVDFQNANSNRRINLSSFQPQPGSPRFLDPNNDWFCDDADYRVVVGCLNSR